jgi:hypothetical protein
MLLVTSISTKWTCLFRPFVYLYFD